MLYPIAPPSQADLSVNLADKLRTYRQDAAYTPHYALEALRVATSRALHAEAQLARLLDAPSSKDVLRILADHRAHSRPAPLPQPVEA